MIRKIGHPVRLLPYFNASMESGLLKAPKVVVKLSAMVLYVGILFFLAIRVPLVDGAPIGEVHGCVVRGSSVRCVGRGPVVDSPNPTVEHVELATHEWVPTRAVLRHLFPGAKVSFPTCREWSGRKRFLLFHRGCCQGC